MARYLLCYLQVLHHLHLRRPLQPPAAFLLHPSPLHSHVRLFPPAFAHCHVRPCQATPHGHVQLVRTPLCSWLLRTPLCSRLLPRRCRSRSLLGLPRRPLLRFLLLALPLPRRAAAPALGSRSWVLSTTPAASTTPCSCRYTSRCCSRASRHQPALHDDTREAGISFPGAISLLPTVPEIGRAHV